jgi:hypothetical protein
MSASSRLGALLSSLVLLGGCFGAYQVSPDNVPTVAGLPAAVEDKDAGLVAVRPGFDIKTYKVVAIDKFPVTDSAIKDEDDRRAPRSSRTSWCGASATPASSRGS